MNILIFIPGINKKSGGIYQYSLGVLNILKNNQTDSFWILNEFIDEQLIEFVSRNSNFNKIENYPGFLNKPNSIFNRALKFIFSNFGFNVSFKSKFDKIIKSLKIDVIHCTYQNFIETGIIPFISTMHDVQELHFPEFFDSEERERRAILYRKVVEKSTNVIVSYNHVKNDLLRYFLISDKNIRIIHLDLNNLWVNKYEDLDKFNLNFNTEYDFLSKRKFILYPASCWPHKNHVFLIKAFKMILEVDPNITLVCTGNLTDYYYNEIAPLIKSLDIQKNVLFTNVVSEELLIYFYKHCIGVVIPTIYEAGSFPLYESILLSKPVICSNVTSLPDSMDSDEFLFDPYNLNEFKTLLYKFIFDVDFLKQNLEHVKKNKKVLKQKFHSSLVLNDFNVLYSSLKYIDRC